MVGASILLLHGTYFPGAVNDAVFGCKRIGRSYRHRLHVSDDHRRSYVIAGVMQSYQNVIRGAGDVNTCMVAGLTELTGRIVFAYLLSGILGVTGIWIATPLSWSCGCIIPVIRYYSGKWKHKRLA